MKNIINYFFASRPQPTPVKASKSGITVIKYWEVEQTTESNFIYA